MRRLLTVSINMPTFCELWVKNTAMLPPSALTSLPPLSPHLPRIYGKPRIARKFPEVPSSMNISSGETARDSTVDDDDDDMPGGHCTPLPATDQHQVVPNWVSPVFSSIPRAWSARFSLHRQIMSYSSRQSQTRTENNPAFDVIRAARTSPRTLLDALCPQYAAPFELRVGDQTETFCSLYVEKSRFRSKIFARSSNMQFIHDSVMIH